MLPWPRWPWRSHWGFRQQKRSRSSMSDSADRRALTPARQVSSLTARCQPKQDTTKNAELRPNPPSYRLNGKNITPTQPQLLRNADTYRGFLEDYYLDNLKQ